MKSNIFKGEKGFITAVFMILMVTLGTMAVSAYYLMNKESENTVNSAQAMQVDYAATGVTYWGIEAVRQGILGDGDSRTVQMEGIDVDASAAIVSENGSSFWRLTVTSETAEGVAREIEVDMTIPVSLGDLAIGAEGTVDSDITPYDETDVVNYDLIQENITLPDYSELDPVLDLTIETITQAKDLKSDFKETPGDLTPWADDPGDTTDADPFFYWENGIRVPYVYYVDCDPAKFYQNYEYYGIFIVNGNVRIQSGHTEIHGVIVQLDPEDTITEEDVTLYGTTGGRYKFSGGVYSYGSVHANGHPDVQHNPVYTETFASFINENQKNRILSWKYK